MRVPSPAVYLALTVGLAGSGSLSGQQVNNPLGQLPTPQKTQSTAKPREQNPAGPVKKDTESPDPTKDPMKDPALDITKDPTKEPELTPEEAAAKADQTGDEQRGADQPGGATEAPDYTGPSILSRGFVLSRPAVIDNTRFQAYVGLSAVYDSGLLSPYVQNGALYSTDSGGADLTWGIAGRKYRRKDIFDLNYQGHYYQYHQNTTAGGQDQLLSFGYMHEFSPHFSVSIREFGGLYSNNFSLLNSVAITDTSLNSSTLVVAPNTEAFDNRTYYSSTQATAVYQMSARLSFSVSAAGFFVKRDSIYLANSTGPQYTADTSYRLTRRQSVGVYYSHTDYQYTKVLANSHADSVGGTYSATLGRGTDLSTRFGISHIDTQGIQTVVLSPFLQSVLGITTGVEKFYVQAFAPDASLTLNRTMQHSSFGITGVLGITPGNGLVLTSRRESASLSWTYTGFRKYTIQSAVGYDNISGYVTALGQYGSYFARVGSSRPIGRNMSTMMTFDYRQQAAGNVGFHQKEWRISWGLRYNPSDLLRF